MSEAPRVPPLAPGDRAPNLTLPDLKGRTRRLYLEVTGGPILVATAPDPGEGSGRSILQSLSRRSAALDRLGVHRFVLTRRPPDAALDLGALVWIDPYGDAMSLFQPPAGSGVRSAATVAVLDPNQRLVSIFAAEDGGDPVAEAVRVAERVAAAMSGEAATLDLAAPALMLDRLLPAALCERLSALGCDRPVADPDLRRDVATRLGARLGNEVRRAFQFRPVLRFQPFRIVDASVSAAARRGAGEEEPRSRFVVLVGLVAGEARPAVVFPEYGPHAYRLTQGGGLAFSCELLHRIRSSVTAPVLATVLAEPAPG